MHEVLVEGIERGGADPEEDLIIPWRWFLDVFIFEDFGPAVVVIDDCFQLRRITR